MSDPDRMKENARRLAGTLGRRSDPQTIERLADILDYLPDQLRQDIKDLYQVTLETEWTWD